MKEGFINAFTLEIKILFKFYFTRQDKGTYILFISKILDIPGCCNIARLNQNRKEKPSHKNEHFWQFTDIIISQKLLEITLFRK